MKGEILVTGKGLGIFLTENKDKYIVETGNLNTALNKDKVEILEINSHGLEKKAKVVRVIERSKEFHTGNVYFRNGKYVFKPDDYRLYLKIKLSDTKKFKIENNLKVLISLHEWDSENEYCKGEVEEIIGKAGEHEAEMKAAVLNSGMSLNFPKEVEEEAENIEKNYKDILNKERSNRKDLTHLGVFTIDPTESKDFDDALSVEKLDNGNYSIGVHIADPTFFVKENSLMDEEARKRATSIYLVDRHIPMIPFALTNNICSINENEEKLAMSIIMEIDKNTNIVSKKVFNSIIKSKKRYDYKGAQETLDSKSGIFYKELSILNELALELEKKRRKDGSIELSSQEVKFKLDSMNFPVEVHTKERLRTMEIIEEFMLLANKEITKFALSYKTPPIPFIFRVHDKPKEEKIADLIAFFKTLNKKIDEDRDGNLTALEINNILKEYKGDILEEVISIYVLRSMQKAIYSTKNIGHFGLAFKNYTHFTSPIRRYPDMIVHRIIKKILLNDESIVENKEISSLASHCSEQEYMASTAEKNSISYMQAKYFSVRIDEVFDGIISNVNKNGMNLFNKKTGTYAFLSVRDMDGDFVDFDENKNILISKKYNTKYILGGKIKATIKDADILNRKIYLKYKIDNN